MHATPAKNVPATAADGYRGTPALGSSTAADFALRDQDGRLVHLSDLRGHVVLLTFLYTLCPDVCPLLAENLNDVLGRLGALRRDVRVVAVSVDPVNDTRANVRRFVTEHALRAEFRYLTGSAAELRPVWQSYNLLIEPRGAERVAHSTYILMVDRAGRPVVYFPTSVPAADVLHDVERALASS
jgi:protein SCO1/2